MHVYKCVNEAKNRDDGRQQSDAQLDGGMER